MKKTIIEFKIRKLLIEAEFNLDNHNADYGTKNKYCLCCNSNDYDSIVGVIHYPHCVIRRIREVINTN